MQNFSFMSYSAMEGIFHIIRISTANFKPIIPINRILCSKSKISIFKQKYSLYTYKILFLYHLMCVKYQKILQIGTAT